jgi:hypothetical protein
VSTIAPVGREDIGTSGPVDRDCDPEGSAGRR